MGKSKPQGCKMQRNKWWCLFVVYSLWCYIVTSVVRKLELTFCILSSFKMFAKTKKVTVKNWFTHRSSGLTIWTWLTLQTTEISNISVMVNCGNITHIDDNDNIFLKWKQHTRMNERKSLTTQRFSRFPLQAGVRRHSQHHSDRT